MQCCDRYGGMYVAPVSMTLWPGKSKDPGLMPVPDKSDDDVLITDCTVAPALWPSQWKMAIFDPPFPNRYLSTDHQQSVTGDYAGNPCDCAD